MKEHMKHTNKTKTTTLNLLAGDFFVFLWSLEGRL